MTWAPPTPRSGEILHYSLYTIKGNNQVRHENITSCKSLTEIGNYERNFTLENTIKQLLPGPLPSPPPPQLSQRELVPPSEGSWRELTDLSPDSLLQVVNRLGLEGCGCWIVHSCVKWTFQSMF